MIIDKYKIMYNTLYKMKSDIWSNFILFFFFIFYFVRYIPFDLFNGANSFPCYIENLKSTGFAVRCFKVLISINMKIEILNMR